MDFDKWYEFSKEDFERLLKANTLESVMLDKEKNLVLICGGYSVVRTQFIFTPDLPAYSVLLEITSPLEINRPKRLHRIFSNEELNPPEELETRIFRWGHFNRVEVIDDESVELWSPLTTPNKPREHYRYRGADYVKMLEKHLGRLKPGDVIDFVTPVPTEQLEVWFKEGRFSKVKLNRNGSLSIWYSGSNNFNGVEDFECPPGTPHIQMLEKYFGPMEPGDVFVISEEDLQ